ncbi:hypothetical protein V6Z12_D13G044500 [Gossypium hirsutum]
MNYTCWTETQEIKKKKTDETRKPKKNLPEAADINVLG